MLNPTYLHLSRCHIYYFRFPIPAYLSANGKASHLKVSLQTRNPKEALRLANMLAYHAPIVLRSYELAEMEYGEIREVLKTYFKRLIEEKTRQIHRDGPLPKDELAQLREEQCAVLEAIKDERNNIFEDEDIRERLLPIFAEQGLDIQEGSPEYIMLAEEYKYALRGYCGKIMNVNAYQRAYGFDDAERNRYGAKPITKVHKLSDVIENYTKEKIRTKSWAVRTIKSKQADFTLLKEILGDDFNIATMTDREAREIKTIILDLPVNRNKNPLIRHLILREAIKVEGVDKISIKTAQIMIGTYYAFFKWAKDHKLILENFFEGLTIDTPKGARQPKRLPFDNEAMVLILDALAKKKASGAIKDYQYWGTLMAIYSGARLNELAQMEIKDVREVEGIWCLDLNDDDEGKHLKNESSKRLVPVHSALLDKGFLEYVETVKKKRHDRVLYELVYDENNGYGRNLGRWFNDSFLVELGLKTSLHVFHSLRHTVVTKLMREGIEQPVVRAIIGHAQEGVLQKNYFTQGYTLKQLADALSKLCY
jgi:site-specific recombinase XerD